jgi:hypothetical protein
MQRMGEEMTYGLADYMKGYQSVSFVCPGCGKKIEVDIANGEPRPIRVFCSPRCRRLEILFRDFKPLKEWGEK